MPTPSKMPGDRVAVIVALTSSPYGVRECLGRFADEVRGRGEVILVDASAGEIDARNLGPIRLIRRPSGRLAPELWRDGLNASNAPLVAFSTTTMIPGPGWLDALLDRLESTGAAAVGGPIEPAEKLGTLDRAVYLLRYANYLRPLPEEAEPELPGENTLYRRDRLHGLEDAYARGFWEAEMNRALRQRGERLVMAPSAVLTFQGGSQIAATVAQRLRHAWRYGASRSERLSVSARLLRAAAAPLVPAVLLRRSALNLRRRGRSYLPWITAVPGLLGLLTAWSLGEAFGTLSGPGRSAEVAQAQARARVTQESSVRIERGNGI